MSDVLQYINIHNILNLIVNTAEMSHTTGAIYAQKDFINPTGPFRCHLESWNLLLVSFQYPYSKRVSPSRLFCLHHLFVCLRVSWRDRLVLVVTRGHPRWHSTFPVINLLPIFEAVFMNRHGLAVCLWAALSSCFSHCFAERVYLYNNLPYVAGRNKVLYNRGALHGIC